MNINEFISWCLEKSISLSLEKNDQLKVNAAPGTLTEDIIGQLRERKLEIINWLQKKMAKRILPRLESEKKLDLSFAQQRLWLLDQIEGGSVHYNILNGLSLRGALDTNALNQAFSSILERHESLRTCFVMGEDGHPLQVIQAASPFYIGLIDLSELAEGTRQLKLSELITEETGRVFDLSRDLMLRAQLIKIAADEHIVLVNMHHIASDGWSMSILVNEFSTLYSAYAQGQANPLSPLPIQYADYAHWQRTWLKGEVFDQQMGYWEKQLAGLPVVHNIPLDYARPPVQSFVGKTLVSQIDADTCHTLSQLCQAQGATLFMGLHAAFAVLLARYSNETDIVVGSPIANREQAEVAGLIGFFVNTLVLRSDLSGSPCFSDLLGQSKAMLLDAYAHQQVPFEQVVERLQPERNLNHGALFQIMLVLQNNEQGNLELPGLTLSSLAQEYNYAKYDIRLDMTHVQEGLCLKWEYSTDLFEQGTIERMAKHFELLLKSLVARPDKNVFDINLLSDQERHQLLVEWNATQKDYPKDQCMHELFEVQAEHNPEAVAVIFENQQLTYGELNQKANQLAHYLITEKQVRPDTLVGICVERSLEMVIGILAILKAGGAYVPLDPEYPEVRLKYMLDDTQLKTVITQLHLLVNLPIHSQQSLCIDDVNIQEKIEKLSNKNLIHKEFGLNAEHLAYVNYTSGSTGNPKGVLITHKAVTSLVISNTYVPLSRDTVMLHNATISFDAATFEIWGVLLNGGRMVIQGAAVLDSEALGEFINDNQINTAWLSAGLFRQFATTYNRPLTKLSYLLVGGDVVDKSAVAAIKNNNKSIRIINGYGPTENTTFSCCYWMPESLDNFMSIPIGKPLRNRSAYVLDENLKLVPLGVVGELHVGGAGLARGYLNRADLTAEKFIPNPFYDKSNPSSSERLYKTGDLVRWLPDGNLEYRGRIDHQVKIRGFRVELGEIENTLNSHENVKDAIVIAKESIAGDVRLLAYIVPSENLQKVEHVVDVNATTFMFDDMYESSVLENNEDPYSNFVGWNSSYNGNPIPLAEMEAWRTATVNRILELNPKRVLEIGIGSGLLFWKIVPTCEFYWGTDISNATLQKLQANLNHYPDLAEKVELRQQDALNFSGLPTGFFDTVIINSVVQYFPDVNYLMQVLHSAVDLIVPNGSIYIGDVRNLRLLPMFQTALQISRAQDDLSLGHVKKIISASLQREEELLLDPEFFEGFLQASPRVSGVDLQVKTHMGHNELTQYRYDVVLRVDALKTLSAKQLDSLEWGRDVTGLAELRQILSNMYLGISEVQPEVLGGQLKGLRIRNVPNQRIAVHKDARRQFETAHNLAELKALINSDKQPLFDFDEFVSCALDTGHVLRVTWASKGHEDLLDVIFIRETHVSKDVALVDVYESNWGEGSSLYDCANNPQLGSLHIKLINSLREYVQKHLPNYMEPNNFVITDSLPLTANGKVDRKALMASDSEYLQNIYVAPHTEMEKVLCEIWQDVLGVEPVGITDNFFQLGGHSLSATRVIARINQAFNVSLALKQLFNAQTPEGLGQAISQQGNILARPVLIATSRGDILLPSFSQQRLWLLDQIDGGSAHYNMPCALRLFGQLSVPTLEQAFTTILERHESLRTHFVANESGEPLQVIEAATSFQIPLIDLSSMEEGERQLRLAELVSEEFSRVFDLSRDLMLRAQLIKIAADEHIVLVNMHHIASDGWSMSILVNEFSTLYSAYAQGQANPLSPLPIQYADYAHWQRTWLKGEVFDQQMGYWEKQLAGLPVVHNIPLDYARPPVQSFVGKTLVSQIDADTCHTLSQLCQAQGATLFMGLHAAFAVLLARYSNETDIVVGSPIANREQAEVAGLIGFFVNTLVLRSDLSGSPCFSDLLGQSKAMLLDAYAHQQVPFEQVVERLQPERNLNHGALFQIMLVLQNNEQGNLELPGLTLSSLAQEYNYAKYDIRLDMTHVQEGLCLKWEYSTDLFEQGTIERMAKHFELLLKSLVARPDKNVFDINLLSDQERHQLLVEWNATQKDYPKDQCMHELFEVQAEHNPEAVAVIFENQQLTYGELNQKANQLAHYLITEKQVRPDTLVGICVERSLEMVIGILAILKAGGAYVPLDPEYPEVRLKYMLDDANLTTVLTQAHLRETTPVSDAQAVCLDSVEFRQKLQTYAAINPGTQTLGLNSTNLAYVIYTSGSTGNPKGVMVEHHSLVNRIDWMNKEYGSSSSDRILQKTPFSFDVSVWEFVWPLAVGAVIVLAKPEGHKDPLYLSALIRAQRITKLHFVPSMLASMLSVGDLSSCATLQQVFCSGEALAIQYVNLFQAICPWIELHNLYGPTEAAIDVSYWDCSKLHADLMSIPIGRPINNIQLYVLNPSLNLVPQGVAGELHIGGVGLARGYLNRPELTNEKFVVNPFYDQSYSSGSERLYKTGDLARWTAGGELEYLGRIDHQVKIRGFRIELGEIENTLRTHSAVKDAVVLAKKSNANNDTQLLAYVVPNNDNLQEIDVVDVTATAVMFDDMYENSVVETNEYPYSNFAGWNNSYNGNPIPLEEMEAWRTSIVDQILELNPKRVLEIGIGSGLIFWKVIPQCEAYWGTDLSGAALRELQTEINSHHDLPEKVRLLQQEALDFSGIPAGFFDTIIINSVVQYFPDANYLTGVLNSAIDLLLPNGKIFIGDIRNLRLLQTFQTAVQVSIAQNDCSLDVVEKLINTSIRREEELLLDPEFFNQFIKGSARISGMDVRVKNHSGDNELTQYRYDVVLHIDAIDVLSAKQFKSLDWGLDVISLAELRKLLCSDTSQGLRICNVPNSRITKHIDVCRQFERVTNIADLKLLLSNDKESACDIEAFSGCAFDMGCKLLVTWASEGREDSLDFIFIRENQVSKETAFIDVYNGACDVEGSLCQYANNPRMGLLHIKLIGLLREYLPNYLPEYMEPNNYLIIDAMPLTPNGKIDRKSLMAYDVDHIQTNYVAPRNLTEKTLCGIWQEILGVERVGVSDNFFKLGGHSLLLTRLMAKVGQTFMVALQFKSLFECEDLQAMSALIDENIALTKNRFLKETNKEKMEIEW